MVGRDGLCLTVKGTSVSPSAIHPMSTGLAFAPALRPFSIPVRMPRAMSAVSVTVTAV